MDAEEEEGATGTVKRNTNGGDDGDVLADSSSGVGSVAAGGRGNRAGGSADDSSSAAARESAGQNDGEDSGEGAAGTGRSRRSSSTKTNKKDKSMNTAVGDEEEEEDHGSDDDKEEEEDSSTNPVPPQEEEEDDDDEKDGGAGESAGGGNTSAAASTATSTRSSRRLVGRPSNRTRRRSSSSPSGSAGRATAPSPSPSASSSQQQLYPPPHLHRRGGAAAVGGSIANNNHSGKYLRNPPKPEVWEEVGNRVLAALKKGLLSAEAKKQLAIRAKAAAVKLTKQKRDSSGRFLPKRERDTAVAAAENVKLRERRCRYVVVKASIDRILTIHDIQLNFGRGRKSNAQHAVQFYNYLLDRIKEEDNIAEDSDEKAEQGSKDDDDNDLRIFIDDGAYRGDPTEEADAAKKRRKDARRRRRKERRRKKKKKERRRRRREKEEAQREAATAASDLEADAGAAGVDGGSARRHHPAEQKQPPAGVAAAASSQIFAAEASSTLCCCVCDDLVDDNDLTSFARCSTCDKLFHGECVRPPMAGTPSSSTAAGCLGGAVVASSSSSSSRDGPMKSAPATPPASSPESKTWRCAYCYLGTEPKHSKPRRLAAAAVRLMARIKNQRIRSRMDGGGGSMPAHTPIPVTVAAGETSSPQQREEEQEEEEKQHHSSNSETGTRGQASVGIGSAAQKIDGEEDQAAITPQTKNEAIDRGNAAEQPSDAAADGSAHGGGAKGKGGGERAEASSTTSMIAEAEGSPLVGTKDEAVSDDKGKKDGTPTSNCSSPSRSKRKLELNRIVSSLSPGLVVEDGGRGKRSRKQPTLYDPQTVPASLWQSDEFAETHSRSEGESDSDSDDSSDTNNDDEDKISSSTFSGQSSDEDVSERDSKDEGTKASLGRTRSKGSGSVLIPRRAHMKRGLGSAFPWCNFCNDDPKIIICCFCACRICFGKHRQSQLLLCDGCEDEFHTFCFDPPIKLPPEHQPWFCPSCLESKDKHVARSSSRTRSPAVPGVTYSTEAFGSGGQKTEEASSIRVRRSSRPAAVKKLEDPPSPSPPPRPAMQEKRSRGRPKKTLPAPPTNAAPSSEGLTKKRGPGRPPKSASKSPAPPPRKRGRPPKSSVKSDKKKRQTEEIAIADEASSAIDADDSVQDDGSIEKPAPVKVSRSGRMVKRSSFHDEIEEGDQHLRSGRYGSELSRKSAASDAAEYSSSDLTHGALLATSLAHVSREETVNAFLPTDVDRKSAAYASAEAPAQIVHPAFACLQAPADTAGLALAPTASPRFSSNVFSSQTELGETTLKVPRRKPGARECMQLSRKFGANVIADAHVETLRDYSQRGKAEHLIRMRERLDEHARFLAMQLAGLEALVKEKGESDVTVPKLPNAPEETLFK